MGETKAGITAPTTETEHKSGIEELATIAGDVQRTVLHSTDSALRSFHQNSSSHLRSLQDFIPQLKSQYQSYEDDLLKKVKGELTNAREHPAAATGIAISAAFLLLRGPRRLLFCQTPGRLQSEEAQFVKAEKNVKELGFSVDLMKKESRKLLERASLAEKDMKIGHTSLLVVGNDIHHLAKSVYKAEAQARDLMEFLREIPKREALKLRAEVASIASVLRQQRMAMDKQKMKICEYGVAI